MASNKKPQPKSVNLIAAKIFNAISIIAIFFGIRDCISYPQGEGTLSGLMIFVAIVITFINLLLVFFSQLPFKEEGSKKEMLIAVVLLAISGLTFVAAMMKV